MNITLEEILDMNTNQQVPQSYDNNRLSEDSPYCKSVSEIMTAYRKGNLDAKDIKFNSMVWDILRRQHAWMKN